VAFLCGAPPIHALTRIELYQATVPLADRSETAQAAAFEAALKIVLVRVTGRRAAAEDPALAPLTHDARRYVQQYRGASENQLWVAFDGAAIERWLTQNSQPLWGHLRPLTMVWLAVQTGASSGTVLSADDASELKSAVSAAAAVRGVPLRWPSTADLQREHLDYLGVSGSNSNSLVEIAHRLGGEGVLIGRAANATVAAPVRWTFVFEERSSESSGDAADGVNRAADAYAGIFAITGGLAPVSIEVMGVKDLHDYARVQAYLESLPSVTHVGVEALSGESVRFQLTTRGGTEGLQHVIALGDRLQSAPAGENGILRFQLRR